MKRTAIEHLLKWSQNEDVRPVILTGAKGVGKTYLACDFAKSFYEQFLYVNFEHDAMASELFKSKDPFKVSALLLEYYSVNKTGLSLDNLSGDRLLILDEVSHCPDALNMLAELQFTGEFHRIIAISSSPIKKEVLDLYYHIPVYPLLFNEFLVAIAKDWYIETIITHFETDKKIPEIVHKELLSLFNLYLIIGGMPGIINEYLNFDNLLNITENHMLLMGTYRSYLSNISSDSEALKMNQVLGSIPLQLLKENKKFQYKLIRKGTTHAMYKESIQNLADRNYIIPSYKITSDELSKINVILEEKRLNVNELTSFKLYLSDVGILNSLITKQVKPPFNKLASKAILENYVAENLQANGYPIMFWGSDSTAKIDFLIPKDGYIIPVELFTDENTRSKNLSVLKQKTDFPYAIKISSRNFGYSKNVKYVPYYAVFCI